MFSRIAFIVSFICTMSVTRADEALPVFDLPVDPSVTQDNIHSTICANGRTKTMRPMWPVIVRIKREKQHAAADPFDVDHGRFELNHPIPLALGGAAADPRNFALKPWAEAREKEAIEACLSVAVCIGRVSLREAQQAIWRDWRAAIALCRIF
jgi:hypothetical protein